MSEHGSKPVELLITTENMRPCLCLIAQSADWFVASLEQVKSGIQDVLRAGGHPVGPLVLRQLYFCVPSLQPSAGAGVLQEMVMMPMQYKGMTCGEVKERIFGKAPCLLRFEYEGDSTSALRTRLPESVQLAHAQPTSACLRRKKRRARRRASSTEQQPAAHGPADHAPAPAAAPIIAVGGQAGGSSGRDGCAADVGIVPEAVQQADAPCAQPGRGLVTPSGPAARANGQIIRKKQRRQSFQHDACPTCGAAAAAAIPGGVANPARAAAHASRPAHTSSGHQALAGPHPRHTGAQVQVQAQVHASAQAQAHTASHTLSAPCMAAAPQMVGCSAAASSGGALHAAAVSVRADMCVAAAGAMVQGAVQRGPVMLQPSATAAGTRAMHSGGAAAAQAAAAQAAAAQAAAAQAAAAQAAAAQMAAKMTAPAADAYVMSGLQKGAAPAVCIKQETCSGCLAGCAFCGA